MFRRYLLVAFAIGMLAGCATVQQILALRSVDFQFDRVADVRLAGIEFSGSRSSSLGDGAQVAAALAGGTLPLSFQLHLLAENPAANTVTARLVRLNWTLYLEDRETVSGQTVREFELPPGRPTDVPINVSLDLLDFYERTGRDFIDLALNLAGAGGTPKRVAVRVVPTVDTGLGPITYPQPITLVAGSVGRAEIAQAR